MNNFSLPDWLLNVTLIAYMFWVATVGSSPVRMCLRAASSRQGAQPQEWIGAILFLALIVLLCLRVLGLG